MNLGYIISLIILGVSLVILIVVGFMAMKKMKPTLKNIEETKKTMESHKEHFTHEGEVIQGRVEDLMARVDYTKSVAEMKAQRFEELSVIAADFGDNLTYLKEHGGDYSKGIAENTYTELKTDGPRLAKTFKLAVQKTIDKQKERYR
ncbi:hypothetical protein GCM10008932_21330 [Alkalibacterium iburiense]|uniref:Uncharacterized protein n=1 Tax=Alkalibacterium iburiense TaxID=290589 RepID=A0ABN0XP95_9LACT